MSTISNLRELYAEFGVAAERAQLIEVEAGNWCLAFLSVFLKPDQITDEQRDMMRSIVEDVNRKTFGTLLKQIKRSAKLDQAILDTIDTALERRNYLMHRFFREHNFNIQSHEGRVVMITELKDIQKQLDLGLATMSACSSSLLALSGWGDEINNQIEKLVAKGKRVQI